MRLLKWWWAVSFERVLTLSRDRIGVLVGRGGAVKSEIERLCSVDLSIDGKTGEVRVASKGSIEEMKPFKAVDIVTAISRGFSPERAFRLADEDAVLDVIDLREYSGRSKNSLSRIKGRIIGLNGKSRRIMEELTGAYVSVYGHTVAMIGRVDEVKLAREAVEMLAAGSPHRSVYRMLQRARTKAKLERMKLWEE